MEHTLPNHVDRLIEQLTSPDSDEKIQTIRRFADLDSRDVKVRLALEKAAYEDPDVFVRSEARSALVKLGFPANPPDGWVPAEPVYTTPPVVQAPDSNVEIQSQAQTTSPFLSIWVKPRGTIRNIVDTNPTKYVMILAMLMGIGQALDNASRRNVGDSLPLFAVLAICILLGPIGGIISLYLYAAIIRWTGSWLGGQATSEEVRAAMAWSSVPILLITLPQWILFLVIYGEEMFSNSTPRMDANPTLAVLITLPFLFATVIAGIWSLVLLAKCVGEVHRFSAWTALGALILGALVFFVPILCIVGVLEVLL